MKKKLNEKLQTMLAKRHVDIELLAKQISSRRGHVHQVIMGRRRGKRTWEKLKDVLEPEEYEVAKEFADGQLKDREKRGLPTGGFPVNGIAA